MDFVSESSVPPDWLLLGVGALFLILGGLVYFLSLRLVGVLIGGGTGILIAFGIATGLELADVSSVILVVAGFVVGGVIGAVIARFAHRALFFLLGAALGGTGAYSLGNLMRGGGEIEFLQNDAIFAVIVVLVALIAGILAAMLDWFLVVVGTSFIGASLLMEGLQWRWGGWPLIPILIVGIILQTALIRGRRARKVMEDHEE